MDRREFLGRAAKTALALGVVARGIEVRADEQRRPQMSESSLKKAVNLSMLPGDMSMVDRFKLAADVGFQGVEVGPTNDPHEIRNLAASSDAEHRAVLQRMRSELDRWILQTHDRGSVPEPPEVVAPFEKEMHDWFGTPEWAQRR